MQSEQLEFIVNTPYTGYGNSTALTPASQSDNEAQALDSAQTLLLFRRVSFAVHTNKVVLARTKGTV